MRSKLLIATLLGFACIAGIFFAQLICDCRYCRRVIGRFFARGELVALVDGSALYEADLRHTVRKLEDVTANFEALAPEVQYHSLLSQLIANLRAGHVARSEQVSLAAVRREYDLARFQIQSQTVWTRMLRLNGFSPASLQRRALHG